MRALDLAGERRGRLVARRRCRRPDRGPGVWWECDCDCGVTGHPVRAGQFNVGQVTSCGCAKVDEILGRSLLQPSPCPEGSGPFWLRRHRQAHGLTIKALAERSGVNPAMLGQYENGVFGPTLAVLVRVGGVLGWDDRRLGEMARLCAAYPWKTRGDYPSRATGGSAKKRFQGV